jgi:tyrosyl-tRNA synthetase
MERVTIEDILTTWQYIPLAQYTRAIDLAKIGVDAKLAKSKSEFNRLVDSGGIRLNGTKVNDPNAYIFFPNNDLTDINSSVIMSIDRERANKVGL